MISFKICVYRCIHGSVSPWKSCAQPQVRERCLIPSNCLWRAHTHCTVGITLVYWCLKRINLDNCRRTFSPTTSSFILVPRWWSRIIVKHTEIDFTSICTWLSSAPESNMWDDKEVNTSTPDMLLRTAVAMACSTYFPRGSAPHVAFNMNETHFSASVQTRTTLSDGLINPPRSFCRMMVWMVSPVAASNALWQIKQAIRFFTMRTT